MDPTDMTTPAATRAGRREWIGLAVLALACLLYAMDLTVLHLAVPALSADLQPSSAQLLWITDIYGFMVAGFLVTMGTLGDRIGRRRLLLLGATAFGALSVLAALSTSPEQLIASRALLGIAGATLAPSTLSLIFNMFQDPGQRSTAIGIWITSFSAGGAIGPVLGGVLLEHYWWGSVFLLAVPVMALLLALGPRVLPEYRDPEAGRLDLVSAAMALVAVLAVVFGLKLTAQDGFDGLAGLAGAAILVGLVVGLLFARRQLTLADPMIDLRLFQNTAFNASLATNLLGIFIAVGYFLFVAQYLQLVLGLSPLEAGLWSLPSAVGFIVGSNLAPRILRRVRPAPVIGAGLAMAAVGLAVLTQVGGSHDADLAILAGASLLVSLGLAPVFTATTDLIVSSAPPERAGAASGISETGSELGGALGIAILGSIGVAVYRGALADTLPADLPAQAAAAARDTLGGAVGVAAQLPAELGAAVLAAAQEAFVRGLQLTAALSAAVAVAIAVVATVLLRDVPAGAEAETAERPAPSAEPAPFVLPEDAFQVIRSGSGCMACPGESRLEDAHGA
ncbi:MAG: transporter [Actinomycetia bacterium]|jgi:DHA2 family multidrug resistance protein-like MFS transporter|nr:transporter [Actinomycetes bacterium]